MPARPTKNDLGRLIGNTAMFIVEYQQIQNPQIVIQVVAAKSRLEVYQDLMTQESWKDHVNIRGGHRED